jgi:hypothetical protein
VEAAAHPAAADVAGSRAARSPGSSTPPVTAPPGVGRGSPIQQQRALLWLQRAAGNRAVQQTLDRRLGVPAARLARLAVVAGAAVQRDIHWDYGTPTPTIDRINIPRP